MVPGRISGDHELEQRFRAIGKELPKKKAERIEVYQDAMRAYDSAMRFATADGARLAGERMGAVLFKANKDRLFGLESSQSTKDIRRATAAPLGEMPIWGQNGCFIFKGRQVEAIVECAWPTLNLFATSFEPFLSETGFRAVQSDINGLGIERRALRRSGRRAAARRTPAAPLSPPRPSTASAVSARCPFRKEMPNECCRECAPEDRRTEAVALLLMFEEAGKDASRLASAFEVQPHRLIDLMERGRNGELERVRAANSDNPYSGPATRYAFAPGSKTVEVADVLAKRGALSRAELTELGKSIGATISQLRHRLTVGLTRAGIEVRVTLERGIAVPIEERTALRALAADAWRIAEHEDD